MLWCSWAICASAMNIETVRKWQGTSGAVKIQAV